MFEGYNPSVPSTRTVDDAVSELHEARKRLDAIEQEIERLEKEVLQYVDPPEEGKKVVTLGALVLEIERRKSMRSDSEKLSQIFGGKFPAYVDTTYSVSTAMLKKLSEAERDMLMPAFKVSIAKPTIRTKEASS